MHLIIVNYNHFENYNILLYFFGTFTLSARKMPNVNKASQGGYCIS
jgi:hypothetical protein